MLMACSPAIYGQTDDFPEKLKAGCPTKQRCQDLVVEAQARTVRCEPNTIGRIRCDDAQADLLSAKQLLDRWDDWERKRAEEKAQKSATEEQFVLEREIAAQRRKHEEERTRALLEAKVAEQERQEAEYIRLSSPDRRMARLIKCYWSNENNCPSTLDRLLEATSDIDEKRRLVEFREAFLAKEPEAQPPEGWNESEVVVPKEFAAPMPKEFKTPLAIQTHRVAKPRQEPAASPKVEQPTTLPQRVQCCDGTLSPSCMCGRSLRGCCSHHHGVCGCE
jgi:hypothetical protein